MRESSRSPWTPMGSYTDHFGSTLVATQRRSLWILMATGRRAEKKEETKWIKGLWEPVTELGA